MSLIKKRHGMLWAANNGSAPTPPTPVLTSHTIRCKFSSGYTPAMGDSQTLVDSQDNVWDIYKSSNNWYKLFQNFKELLEVIAANTTGITSMNSMFDKCSNLTSTVLFDTASVTSMQSMFAFTKIVSIPLFSTASAVYMQSMFEGCYYVESGALALYQQASTQATPPTYYSDCFTGCGGSTSIYSPIRSEMRQIPASWGGNGT